MNTKYHNICSCSTSDIWKNYSIGTVPLAIVPIIPLVFGIEGLAFASLIGSLSLFLFVRHERDKEIETCALFPYLTARILLSFTALIIVAITVGVSSHHTKGEAWGIGLCQRTSLYLSLFGLLVQKLRYLRVGSNTFCNDCLLRNGMPAERKHLGHNITDENRYLANRRWLIFLLIFLITIGSRIMETYYSYSSEMLQIVYVYIPMAIVAADVVFVRLRYYVLGQVVKQRDARELPFDGQYKLIRLLVFCDDGLLLSNVNDKPDATCSCYIPYTKLQCRDVAHWLASEITREKIALKFCYSTIDPVLHRGIEHYICFIDSRNDAVLENGKWIDKAQLETDFSKAFNPLLQAELHRLYTVMLSSKKYDVNGIRKIDLDGYQPTFNFREFKTTNVDFNDNRWMLLSKFNDERALASVRKVWYKYIEGLNLK